MIEKIRLVVESLGYPFFFGTRDEVYAYINRMRTCVAVYRQGNATGASQSLVFKFKGTHPQKMYYDVFAELKKVLTIGVQRAFFYDDVLEVRCPVMNRVFIGGGGRPTPPVVKGLKLKAVEANSTVSMSSSMSTPPEFEYSIDGGNTWTPWSYSLVSGQKVYDVITLGAVGDAVCIRGLNTRVSKTSGEYTHFVMSGKIEASGDVTALLNNEGGDIALEDYTFANLFRGCSALIKAPNIPSTTLSEGCYYCMFYESGLIEGPELPAKSLVAHCYEYMFARSFNMLNVKVHAESWNTAYTFDWLSATAWEQSGVLTKPTNTTIPSGNSGVPSNWTTVNF